MLLSAGGMGGSASPELSPIFPPSTILTRIRWAGEEKWDPVRDLCIIESVEAHSCHCHSVICNHNLLLLKAPSFKKEIRKRKRKNNSFFLKF